MHALGYWIPEHHIVRFQRKQLVASPMGHVVRATGKAGRLAEEGIDLFDPAKWYPNYAVTALVNRLRDDDYWAAKKVIAFSDEEIRALVEAGEYSDPRAVEWITQCLIERRDKIGKFYLSRILPLENFRI